MNNTHKALIVSSVLTIAVAIKHKFLNRKHKKLQKELEKFKENVAISIANHKIKEETLLRVVNGRMVDTTLVMDGYGPSNDVSYPKNP